MASLIAVLHIFRQSLADAWAEWVDLVVLNAVWLLATVTVILAPPALLALFHTTRELAMGRGVDIRMFIQGIRLYFVRGWLWGLLNIAFGALFVASLTVYGQIDEDWSTMAASVSFVIAALWIMVQFYGLSYLVFQEKPNLLVALRNGLYTILASPLFSFLLGAILIGLMLFTAQVLLALLAGIPALLTLIANRAVRDRLETFGLLPRPAQEVEGG
ncbi:MAG: DUF624 domain-containing protein [Chloroflexi bacterium]|nr:DUF624 domain-containing protein [Chloroflexota bacterium]